MKPQVKNGLFGIVGGIGVTLAIIGLAYSKDSITGGLTLYTTVVSCACLMRALIGVE